MAGTGADTEAAQEEFLPEDSILLDRLKGNISLKQCCDSLVFALVTLLVVVDMVTHIWVIVIYGQRQDTVFMGVLAFMLIIAGLLVAIVYSSQVRMDSNQSYTGTYLYLCMNFPLQLGVIYQRLIRGLEKCRQCCPAHAAAHGPRGKSSNTDWKFANLKLIQSMLQCAPQLIGNLLHMFAYRDASILQIVSAATSFLSLILGVVLRKKQVSGAMMGVVKLMCIFVYKTLVISTRIMALVYFMYYFRGWVAAVLIPHIGIMLSFFLYLYRQVWKVQYHVIFQHSVYSVLAYFPIHSEYRPEGEIVLFYVLHMVENIIMVALPFKASPVGPINPMFVPTSRFYFVMMLGIHLGSTVGLLVMCVYYFVFHKSRHSIRETNLGWLACLCEWRKPETDSAVLSPTLSISTGATRTASGPQTVHSTRHGYTSVSHGVAVMCTTQVSSKHGGFLRHSDAYTPVDQTENDADSAILSQNLPETTTAQHPETDSLSERLLIQDMAESRPSVLEGEDDEFDQEATSQGQPIIV